jgi:hypothetical protein
MLYVYCIYIHTPAHIHMNTQARALDWTFFLPACIIIQYRHCEQVVTGTRLKIYTRSDSRTRFLFLSKTSHSERFSFACRVGTRCVNQSGSGDCETRYAVACYFSVGLVLIFFYFSKTGRDNTLIL